MPFSLTAARQYACALFLLLASGSPAMAQSNLAWDRNGAAGGNGGGGTWNTTTASWFNGATYGPWSAVTLDNATFGGTAGTVTLGVPVGAHNLAFDTTGYTVRSSTLTLGGTTPTITTNAALATISSVIAGTAGLTTSGTGTLVLSGTNTYSGGTTISAGTLRVGSGGTTGVLGSGNITNNAALVINRSNALTVGNDIAGTGTLTKLGAGTTTLTGANTYSGTTTISAGTLQVGNGGATGALGTGNVTNNAALRINRSDAYTIEQNISGSGTLTQFGSGTTTLTGTNTYTGATTISAGTLQIGNGGSTGALGTGTVANNSVLEINRSNAVAIGQAISGTGTLRLTGTGTTTLTGNNTYSGGTTISAGTLQVGNGGTTGALGAGAITNNAALVINRSNSVTFGQAISGSGTLTQLGAGTTTLTGANTYSGTTTISAGILQVGAGGTTGTLGSAAVVNNAALRINRSDAITLGQDISGVGTLTKLGAGTTTLTGANTYSGTTTISAGTLQVGNGGTTGTLGTGSVTNSAALRINRSNAYTIAQNISGSGTLTQFGSGTTTLAGTNTYTGATTISAGTLQVGDGGTTGTLGTGAVINNSVLDFNRSNALTIGQVISGTGRVGQEGTGTTTLTGNNTYSGGTTISGGTLQVGSGGTGGALGTGSVTNDGALVINRSNTVTFAQSISGTGTLTKLGAGTTTLTGANTYSGTTTISAGILQVGSGGTTGTLGSGDIVNNAALRINRSDAVTLGQAIGGAGTLTKLGAGTTTLTGANNYSGTTTISAGVLQVGNGGTTGTLGSGNIANSAALRINRSDAITLGQTITGSGTFTQFGSGTTTLTGANTYSGVTTISAGTLQVGSGGMTGSLGTGNITNNSILEINRSNAYSISRVMSGTGSFSQVGGGTTTLTGANTYSGTTTISAGVLQVGSGGTAGTLGSGAVINNAGLVFNRSNTNTIANNISGTGTVTKVGAGTTTLTGSSTYTGATTVNAGTLRVNGSLGNTAVTIASGATIGGSGTIAGSVTVNSGGKLAPGNSPGTLTVGSLNLMSGAIMNVEFATPGVVGGGVNDLIEVNGDVTLDGTLNVSALAGFGIGKYRLMNYTGTLFNNVLDFGAMPAGYAYQLQTAFAGRLSLLVGSSTAGPVQYWDGTNTVGDDAVSGGSATWTAGPTNWTLSDGSFNLGWGGQTAVFAGAPGTVSVVGPVSFNGLQFQTSGYTLAAGFGGVLTTTTANTAISLSPAVTATIAAPIAGSGGINLQGFGTLIFTGENTYTGGTTIGNGSTLQIGDGGTSGSIVGNVANDGTLAFKRADTITFGGEVSGTGMLRQDGAGTLILTGSNSYSGGTTIATGSTLQLGDGGTVGSIIGDVANGGALVFNRSNTIGFGGRISGAGEVRQEGSGTVVLSGLNTYSGGTSIHSGTLSISAHENLGTGGLFINGGTLQTTASFSSDRSTALGSRGGAFDTNSGTHFNAAGIISGAGALTKAGGGTLTLGGVNTYSGGTKLNAGTVSISRDANLGSPSGAVVFDGGTLQTIADLTSSRVMSLDGNGTIETANGSTLLLQGAITGVGTLNKSGNGRLVLTATNTYGGGTQVHAGTLQGNTTSLQGQIVNDASLMFDQAFDGAFGGTLFGAGTMIKRGSGVVSLTGNHGLQGLTTIESGTLALNGTMAGAVSVSRDGTFDAVGVVGESLSVDGRVNVPSSAAGDLGVLGVVGDAMFRPDSTYGVTLNADGQNSALIANGDAWVQGATIAVTAAPGAYGRVTQYAVMRGEGGLSGMASATSSSTALEPLVSKNDTTLFVTLLNREVPLQRFAISSNGSRIAIALDRLKGTESAHLAHVTRELTALDDRTLALSLDAMSGEIHASAIQLSAIDGESATDTVRSELSTRTSQGNGETTGGTPWGFDGGRSWFRFRGERNSFDSSGEVDGVFGVRGATGSINGFAMGRDWTRSHRWLFGAGGSFATGRMALNGLRDATTFTSPRGVAYAGYAGTGWAVDGGVAVARTAFQTTRSVQFTALAPGGGRLLGGVDQTATSRPSGIAAELWSEVRIDKRVGPWRVQPTAGMRRARYGLSEYTEDGADSLALSAPARSIDSLQADTGVRVSRALGAMRPYLGGVVRRELRSGQTAAGLSFANDPNGSFEVDGLQLSKHSTIGQAGLLFRTGGVGLSMMYEARRTTDQFRQTLQLGVDFE